MGDKFSVRKSRGRPLEEAAKELPEWEGKTDHFGSRIDASGLFFKVTNQILIDSNITLTEVVRDFHLLATGKYREITVNGS